MAALLAVVCAILLAGFAYKKHKETLPEEDIYEQTDNSVAEDDKEASEPMDTDQDKNRTLRYPM